MTSILHFPLLFLRPLLPLTCLSCPLLISFFQPYFSFSTFFLFHHETSHYPTVPLPILLVPNFLPLFLTALILLLSSSPSLLHHSPSLSSPTPLSLSYYPTHKLIPYCLSLPFPVLCTSSPFPIPVSPIPSHVHPYLSTPLILLTLLLLELPYPHIPYYFLLPVRTTPHRSCDSTPHFPSSFFANPTSPFLLYFPSTPVLLIFFIIIFSFVFPHF